MFYCLLEHTRDNTSREHQEKCVEITEARWHDVSRLLKPRPVKLTTTSGPRKYMAVMIVRRGYRARTWVSSSPEPQRSRIESFRQPGDETMIRSIPRVFPGSPGKRLVGNVFAPVILMDGFHTHGSRSIDVWSLHEGGKVGGLYPVRRRRR
jgi:hypothetical protein